MEHSRKDYRGNQCSHSVYYSQFVDSGVLERVKRNIGIDRILTSKNKGFNDIALSDWIKCLNPMPRYVADKLRECGDFPTIAGGVCICKQAAKQIKLNPDYFRD